MMSLSRFMILSAKFPPNIDVTRAPLAYGSRALPKLNRELNDSELIVRQRSVRSLCDYLKDPQHITNAIKLGTIQELKPLLEDPDLTVRRKATECIYLFASCAVGRDALIALDIITCLSKLFQDPEPSAMLEAHKATEMLCQFPAGASAVNEAMLIRGLVEQLEPVASNEVRVFILDTLHHCMILDTLQTLESNAMEIFTALLSHDLPEVRSRAARNIMDLSVTLAGKEKAVEGSTIPALILLLVDEEPEVRSKAACALSIITITTAGKYKALECDALGSLVLLVDDANTECATNSLKAITCLSEAPEGRKELLKHVEKIRQLTYHPTPALAKHARIAEKVITWRP